MIVPITAIIDIIPCRSYADYAAGTVTQLQKIEEELSAWGRACELSCEISETERSLLRRSLWHSELESARLPLQE